MNTGVAFFEKVSFEEYRAACLKAYGEVDETAIQDEWEAIRLPSRATIGSAGYDFFIPRPVALTPRMPVMIPTGIRCGIQPDYFLMLCPKSGLGVKYGTRLLNTIGIVDSDYYRSDNEGHILCAMETKKALELKAGDKFVQGIFIPFGVVVRDHVETLRNGGFGSTSESEASA